MVDLLVDSREAAVCAALDDLTPYRRLQLVTSDFSLSVCGKLRAVYERKTLADLAASIKDGRMGNNAKLVEARERNGGSVLIVYIIEGSANTNPASKIGGIAFGTMLSVLDGLMLRYGAHIVWTRGAEDTAKYLARVRAKMAVVYADEIAAAADALGVQGVQGGADADARGVQGIPPELLERKEKTIDETHVLMLTCVEGVGRNVAVALLQRYSLYELLTPRHDEAVMRTLLMPSGTAIGQVRAARICARLSNIEQATQADILSNIRGISKKLASTILTHVPFVAIIECTVDFETLADLPRHGKVVRRLGEVLARRIYDIVTAGRVDVGPAGQLLA
jgi:ERCC4-type nuclease